MHEGQLPDPVSADLARITFYSYDEVHEALWVLADAGWPPETAARFVRGCSANGTGDPAGLARFVVKIGISGELSEMWLG